MSRQYGRPRYEADRAAYPEGAYTVSGWKGIAFYVLGWEVQPDEDTEWTGIEERTGRLAVVMIGDDRIHIVDPDEVTPLARDRYCASCGQIGCTHDGR